jgi:hypothetical protein
VPGLFRHARSRRVPALRPTGTRRVAARFSAFALALVVAVAGVVVGLVVGSGHRAGAVGSIGNPVAAPHRNTARVPAGQRPTVAMSTCPRPAPTTAAGYQHLFDAQYGAWAGGDQSLSLALPNGRTLWIFADTISGNRSASGGYAHGWTMRHNSFVEQDRGCLTAAGPTPLPDVDSNHWYWPNSALVSGGRLYIFAMRVRRAGDGWAGFTVYGTSLATFALPRSGPPRLQSIVALPRGNADGTILWGAGAVAAGPWVYVYGTQAVPAKQAFGRRLLVARARTAHLSDPRAWQYLNATSFTSLPAGARPVIDAAGGVSTSVSVLPAAGGGVTVVSKRDEVFGRSVAEWAAPTPAGPFTLTDPDLFSAPSLTKPGELLYTAQAHQEARLAGGALLVTICRNNIHFKAVEGDSRLYRPQFSAVPQPG